MVESVATSIATQVSSTVVPIATSIDHEIKDCVQDVEECVEVIAEQLDEWIDAKIEIPITAETSTNWQARKEIQIPTEYLPDLGADMTCINCHLQGKLAVKTVMDSPFTADKEACNADMDDFTCALTKHFKEAYLELKFQEDIDVYVQFEFSSKGEYDYKCDPILIFNPKSKGIKKSQVQTDHEPCWREIQRSE